MIHRLLSKLFQIKSKYGFQLKCGRIVDPLKCYRNLLYSNVNKLLDERESTSTEIYYKAETELIQLIRKTFELPELTKKGYGYSDQDCLDVLDDFFVYIEKKGEKVKTLATSPQPTNSIPLSYPTSNDCGCT